jgi:protein SCO1/2
MTKINKKDIYILLTFLLIFKVTGFTQETQLIVPQTEIGIEEHLDGILPDSVYLVNENGDTVSLKSQIDKPTIVNFVYFRCPGICTPVMDGIADLISKSDMVIGKDYQVLTISFDIRESIDLAIKKKKNYMTILNKPEAETGWKFFVSDSASIAKATSALGFIYKRNGNDFLHAAAIMIISPKGKITRYHYGTFYQPFEFKMSVIEASEGKSAPTINRILKFCYTYDPKGKQYMLNVTKVSGSIIIFIALVIFLILAIKPIFKRKNKLNSI